MRCPDCGCAGVRNFAQTASARWLLSCPQRESSERLPAAAVAEADQGGELHPPPAPKMTRGTTSNNKAVEKEEEE